MKKTISLVAVLLILCVGFAAISEAVTTFVADGEAKILKTVTDGETIAEYFTSAAVKGTSQGWGDAVDPAAENVEVDGERFLKITLDNQNFNFRLTLDSDPAPETVANIVGYGYLRLRVKVENAMTLSLGIDDGNTEAILDRFWLVSKDGELVATGSTYNGVDAPAGFDGYLYASLTHWTFQGGALGSRDKDSSDPVANPNNESVILDPTAVRRGNQVWSGTGAVYFGELALVNGGVQELIPNKPGDHMNFVVLNGLNSLNGLTGITFPYTSSPDITLALEENGANNDEYHFQFNESNYAIFKFQNMGLPQTIAALDPSAVALGFYVRVGSEDVAIWQLQIPEGGTLYAAEDWKLFDLSGNEVLFAAANHTIPAGFEGYVYIPNATASDLGSVIGWISSSVGADLYMDNFGYFTAEPTVAPDVEILGVQESAVDAGTFDARIVCGVNDLLFRELKFHYNALENGNYHWTDEQVADVTEVYTTIQIDGIADAEATTFGYNYLAALTIQGIPADGVIEITVEMSYVREADLSTELTTALYSIIYIDGVFQSFGIA